MVAWAARSEGSRQRAGNARLKFPAAGWGKTPGGVGREKSGRKGLAPGKALTLVIKNAVATTIKLGTISPNNQPIATNMLQFQQPADGHNRGWPDKNRAGGTPRAKFCA